MLGTYDIMYIFTNLISSFSTKQTKVPSGETCKLTLVTWGEDRCHYYENNGA